MAEKEVDMETEKAILEDEENLNENGATENAAENSVQGDDGAEVEQKEENGVESTNQTEDDSQKKQPEYYSEDFKVEIGGLPKHFPLGQLKKLLNTTLQLDAQRVKSGVIGNYSAFANFKDEDARFKVLTIINGYKWQGSTLTAKKAEPSNDPGVLAKIDFIKLRGKDAETLSLNEKIQKAVTPLHDMPYEEQLKDKERVVRQVLRKFGTDLMQLNPELKHFVHWHKIRRKGQICEVDDIIESPIKEGYCNKCEFTIGKNTENEKPVVGFRVASSKVGCLEVGPISHLRHLNDKIKLVVLQMEKYLVTSAYEPFDPISNKGIWRQLTVRTSNNEDVMLIVAIHPQELGEEDVNELKENLKNFFVEGEGQEAGMTSLFFQQYGQV